MSFQLRQMMFELFDLASVSVVILSVERLLLRLLLLLWWRYDNVRLHYDCIWLLLLLLLLMLMLLNGNGRHASDSRHSIHVEISS